MKLRGIHIVGDRYSGSGRFDSVRTFTLKGKYTNTKRGTTMDTMSRHALVVFTTKRGKVKYTVYGYSSAMLSMYALRHLKAHESAIIVDMSDGKIIYKYEGNTDNFPKRTLPDKDCYVSDLLLENLIMDDPFTEEEI